MNRRGFMQSMLAAAVAPYIARVEALMPVRPIWVPPAPRGSEIALLNAAGEELSIIPLMSEPSRSDPLAQFYTGHGQVIRSGTHVASRWRTPAGDIAPLEGVQLNSPVLIMGSDVSFTGAIGRV